MGVGIAFIVVGAVAALSAGLLANAKLPGRLSSLNLEPGGTAIEIVSTSGFVLPASGATYLTEGHPAWVRIAWIVAALCGSALLYAVPHRWRRHLTEKREIREPAP